MNSQIGKSGTRKRLASTFFPWRHRGSLLAKRPVWAVRGGIVQQTIGVAMLAILLVVGAHYATGYLGAAHSSATNSTLSSVTTAANSIYDQQDGFAPLQGETTFGASLTQMEPSVKFVKPPATTTGANSVVYERGPGTGATGVPQSVEFTSSDNNGHCMFVLVIVSGSSSVLTGTVPAGVTGPGTYYAAAPAGSGACGIATYDVLPTSAEFPSSGAAMSAWQTTPIQAS